MLFDSVISVKQVPQERMYKNYIKFKFKTDYRRAREINEGKSDCILHNVLLAMGFKAWHRNKKKKAYIVIFILLKFKIRNKSYLK